MKFNDDVSTHSIVRVPCPHCHFLCSSIAKACPKCGEPLTPLGNTASKEKNFALIREKAGDIALLRQLEKVLSKKIPQVDEIKRGKRGFLMLSDEIIAISLYKFNLEFIPPEIFELKSLKELYLRRNKITEVSHLLGLMENLEILDLSINEIKKLHPSIGFLSNLKRLNLASNKLIILPETMGSLSSLKKLILTNNRLKLIPKSIENLPSLKNLDLRGNLLLVKPQTIIKKKKKRKRLTQTSLMDFD